MSNHSDVLSRLLDEEGPNYHDCMDNGEPECVWCELANLIPVLRQNMEKLERYEQALNDILKPIDYLKRYAAEKGTTINGTAYTLSNDASFIKGLAKAALNDDSR